MKTSDFDYQLPPDRIAAHPVRPRDAARMLFIGDSLADRAVRDLPDFLRPQDLLVVNNTKVLPTRLVGSRRDATIEATLHARVRPGRWRAFVRPAKRLKLGDCIEFAPEFSATVMAKGDGGEIELDFDLTDSELIAALKRHGAMPLPPYIKRDQGPDPGDRTDYQTIFAAREGAVAAPTAALHFSDALRDAIVAKCVDIVDVTLHVGAGTFLPVKTDDPHDHIMHAEWGRVSAETAAALNGARAAGGRIVAVGTTVLRLLETAAADSGQIQPFEGETDIFILPGYRFKAVDALMTNFHLPRSTLLMLVAAFAGRKRILNAYAHAVEQGYRFYSYGDCCFVEP
ncbi:MAG: tRNA preQ1(34) S-adenosylmethionine ribosyltransferase-isomerase QueA, partial [Alphaproteobacteria bacterium]|nr:tRNA preQ1(34) S-adenosylmethionine ribosyltransferase-isomerase QueA [Alphaproteobacteria bacterium]